MSPLCLIEGMALGLPAIGTRYSGIPEIIVDGETGILVEPRDEIGLALAIELSSARRSALARVKSFSATAVVRTYLEQYEAAMRVTDRQVGRDRPMESPKDETEG